ncbi:uncharacterized protein Z520_01334 [Fonsecaea multimorphosa CBS 102226]|uniref:F-box domain-containing protein n=1 Tax=Fonsecaea multimorphosa CBS 102226 TaxID=1442371 RepID=A0A0D2L1E6_9EURO|nr:uncharacterized protein Z520_01334 [Fonsecaea multimorphosa CBS 102226]KIY02869.1 hypothetical protein Z520_01334 [Fonsecaea multimorphosa CBS 102226]OAL30707.1 hypothetical protein AYO22_01327 [Fonsecaea multimorphosa]
MAQATTEAIQPFSIPQEVLSTVSDDGRSSSSKAIHLVSRLRNLPRELFLLIFNALSYRELVLLALTCKSMAIFILNDPIFTIVANAEEAKHAALGHYETVLNAFPFRRRLPYRLPHRSLLWCSHFTCPFFSRRLREWQRKVRKSVQELGPEHKVIERREDKHRQKDGSNPQKS